MSAARSEWNQQVRENAGERDRCLKDATATKRDLFAAVNFTGEEDLAELDEARVHMLIEKLMLERRRMAELMRARKTLLGSPPV